MRARCSCGVLPSLQLRRAPPRRLAARHRAVAADATLERRPRALVVHVDRAAAPLLLALPVAALAALRAAASHLATRAAHLVEARAVEVAQHHARPPAGRAARQRQEADSSLIGRWLWWRGGRLVWVPPSLPASPAASASTPHLSRLPACRV